LIFATEHRIPEDRDHAPQPDRCRGEPTTYVSSDHLLSPTPDAVDIHRLTRYSLREGFLRPEAEGEFVSFAALKQEMSERTGTGRV
jgi:hypothetical protein